MKNSSSAVQQSEILDQDTLVPGQNSELNVRNDGPCRPSGNSELSETNFRDLFEILPDAVYIHRDKKIVYVNSAGVRLYGASGPEELLGRSTFSFIPQERWPQVEARLIEMVERNAHVPMLEQQRLRLDGTLIDVEVAATPCVWDGAPSVLVVSRDISERKRTEAKLGETEARLQGISSSLPGMFYQRVRHPDGTIEFPFVSDGSIEVLGVEPEAAMDKPAVMLDLIHPDDRQFFQQALKQSAETRDQLDIQFRIIPPSGGERWVRSVSNPRDGTNGDIVWDAMMFNITERKAVEFELKRSEARYRSFLETSPDAIYVHIQDRIVYANESAVRLFRAADAGDLVGRMARSLYRDEDREQLSEVRERIRKDGRIAEPTEFRLVRLDGTELHGEATAALIDWDSEPAIFVNIRDISERKEAERELERLNYKLLDQTRELQRSNADLEQFAYIASHDLQEPLRMISGYCQLLQRRYTDKLDSDANEFIEFAVEGAGRMQRLISDILTYSRVGTRGQPMDPVDLGEVFEETTMNLKAAIDEAAATVTSDPMPTVMGDRSQLSQLLQNLISNALKFHGEDSPRIHFGVRPLDKEWEFSVADNGIGIEPEYRDRIFLIFQRLHNRSEYPGTGIGLAVCQKIVNRHGGLIRVETSDDGGSNFLFTLPKSED